MSKKRGIERTYMQLYLDFYAFSNKKTPLKIKGVLSAKL